MYGIFTYIWLICYSKCMYIYHTWMLWDTYWKLPFFTGDEMLKRAGFLVASPTWTLSDVIE